MEINFELSGIDKIVRKFTSLSQGEADEAVYKGLVDGGFIVQSNAKNRCPVDEDQLRSSIVVTQKDNFVDVGTDVEYAPYVEYGTGLRGDPSVAHVTEKEHIKDGKKTGEFYPYQGMSPQPYLYPAMVESEDMVRGEVRKRLINAMRGN